MNIVEKGF